MGADAGAVINAEFGILAIMEKDMDWTDVEMELGATGRDDLAEWCSDEVAKLRKDAERYRLLRRGQHWSVIDGIGDTLRSDDLDAAIDAAMKTPNKEVRGD